MNPSTRYHRLRRAFSLIELLAVLAIIAILAALILGGMGTSSSTHLTNSANKILDTVSLARELAIAKNQPVEVWFLRHKNSDFLNAIQVRLVESSGQTVAWGGLKHLGTGIGIDSGQTLSPLLANANAKQWTSGAAPEIGSLGTDYDCWFVRFQPDGTPTLAPNTQHYLTLHKITDGDQLASLPPNFAIVSVSPATGKATIYRP